MLRLAISEVVHAPEGAPSWTDYRITCSICRDGLDPSYRHAASHEHATALVLAHVEVTHAIEPGYSVYSTPTGGG